MICFVYTNNCVIIVYTKTVNIKIMELTKNANYKDSIYKWGTLIYTGKTKKINYGMGDYYKAHCFIYKDDNFPDLFKNKKIYIPSHAISDRITTK